MARVEEVREKGPDEVREIEMAENQDVAGQSLSHYENFGLYFEIENHWRVLN